MINVIVYIKWQFSEIDLAQGIIEFPNIQWLAQIPVK